MDRLTPDLPQRLPLSGDDWLLKDFVGEDWLWRNAHKPGTRDVRGWRPATVPGSVHHDLWRAGEIANPYTGRNSLLAEWASDRTWIYKKTIHAPQPWNGRRLRLCFEGIDYEARIFLNGDLLGRHVGQFVPAVFDVSDRLQCGSDNLLAVVVEPVPFEQPQVGYTSRVRTFKTRMNYWWDFCPRLVHLGLWDDVWLDVTGPAAIDDVWVRPRLAPDLRSAEVDVTTTLDSPRPLRCRVTTTLLFEGQPLTQNMQEVELLSGTNTVAATLSLPEPRLWWPNGHGPQPLYTAEVLVETGAAEPTTSDRRAVTFGVRSLTLEPNEGAGPTARPYTLTVNGRRLYIKGWNWVPMDVLYGVERPAKRERLLRLAQRAHVNMLRVWGGGLIEKRAFYDLCDRLGLLVWQEFIQSSSGIENNPPEDPGFIAWLADHARRIVPRRRNHASLALWCGGNELQVGPDRPAGDSHPALAALRAVVEALDPGRPWLPTSSSGPVFANTLENIEAGPHSLHDVHGPWEHQGLEQHFTLYNRGTSLLHSEFGVEGLTNRRALDAAIPPKQQAPVSLDNPLWRHLGAWWVKADRWREMWGDLSDVEAVRRATQFTQASGLQYAIEANRRRKYRNSGSLPWQFNEPYPMAACTSAVDYFARPKPVYYAVARAYAPVLVSARFDRQAWPDQPAFEAQVWANNSRPDPLGPLTLRAALIAPDGRRANAPESTHTLPANAAFHLADLRWNLSGFDSYFFLDLALHAADGAVLAANRYVFARAANLAPLLAAPPTQLRVTHAAHGDAWAVQVENAGATAALFVWLEDALPLDAPGGAFFDDNYFCLLPGEARQVRVAWTDVPGDERRLTLSAWNAPAAVLGSGAGTGGRDSL